MLLAFLLGHTIPCQPLTKGEAVHRVGHNVALASVENFEILVQLSLRHLQNVRILVRDRRRAGRCRGNLRGLPLRTLARHDSNKTQEEKRCPSTRKSQKRLKHTPYDVGDALHCRRRKSNPEFSNAMSLPLDLYFTCGSSACTQTTSQKT